MIQDYLSLQKLRYGDIINDKYDISPDTLKIKIIKNILQPLVENSIYHGIKPSGEAGTIIVSSSISSGLLFLSIKDDGLGMTPSEIENIISENLDKNRLSFGLRGTIQRLKIHYGVSDIYSVKSEKYVGTTITLKIPLT